MKKIKIGYDIVLLLCTSLFVFIWDINIYWKAFITSVIILISILYYTISIFIKFYTNSQIDILIKALLDELPQKEFKDLLFEIIKTHDHTLNGLFKTWDRISEFADENFSEENQYKVKLLLYHIDDVHKFKPYKVYKAMKMDNTSLFYQYMNAFFEKNIGKEIFLRKVCLKASQKYYDKVNEYLAAFTDVYKAFETISDRYIEIVKKLTGEE